MNSFVISFSWFCLLGTKPEITDTWRDSTPSNFSWTVLSARKRGKGQSIYRNLNLRPENERTRSRVFPTTFLQNSFLRVSYEKYPLPYCNSGSIFYLMENKKAGHQESWTCSMTPMSGHLVTRWVLFRPRTRCSVRRLLKLYIRDSLQVSI